MGDDRNENIVFTDRDLVDLVPSLFAALRRDAVEIESALERRDFERIATLGHAIKGSADSYGFGTVGALGRRLERAARARHDGAIAKGIMALRLHLDSIDVVTAQTS